MSKQTMGGFTEYILIIHLIMNILLVRNAIGKQKAGLKNTMKN